MKRRNFGLVGACSIAAIGAGIGFPKRAHAAPLTSADADRLKSELTPFGAERAGNADGSIPAWTGENLPLPPGGGPYALMPDFFASDAKVVSIDASNMAQYQDKLSPGTMSMMTQYPGYRIDVYPTHRTAIGNQEFYDNTHANVTRVQAVSGGSRLGFTGGYGGLPFPILDQSDPFEGGAQAIWNHSCRWFGPYQTRHKMIHSVISGQQVLVIGDFEHQASPYFYPGGTPEGYGGYLRLFLANVNAPAQSKGQSFIEVNVTNPTQRPTEVWEYLVGQGRVRKAPELQYDTPESQTSDITNYDESYGFYGNLDRYDRKLIGKKELYIPYNNNKLFLQTEFDAHKPSYIDPDFLRWELHRVWVVDAVLHPGERNVLAHRVFYIDEDTMTIGITDAYDAEGKLFRVVQNVLENRPDIPAKINGGTILYNVQTNEYVTSEFTWNSPPYNGTYSVDPIPTEMFNPTSMAAGQEY